MMQPFSDYLATRPPLVIPAKVGYDRPDIEYSLGGNDRIGSCALCAPANHIDLCKAVIGEPQVVMEAEIERFYGIETGWTPLNPATDKGAILATVLQDFTDNGWPTDPTYKPRACYTLRTSQIAAAVHAFGAVCTWIMLPTNDEGYDWSNAAFPKEGEYAHAVLIVGADEQGYDLITWAERRRVSRAWFAVYGRDSYVLDLPDWIAPT